jgi:hypothetical protein
MRRMILLAGLTFGAVAAIAVLAISAGGQSRTSQAPADFTVTNTFRDRNVSFVDNRPRRRESPGDVVLLPGTFTGAKSGSLLVSCTVIKRPRRNRETSICTGTAVLADGQIAFQGAIVGDPATVTIPIVGGTGLQRRNGDSHKQNNIREGQKDGLANHIRLRGLSLPTAPRNAPASRRRDLAPARPGSTATGAQRGRGRAEGGRFLEGR